MDSWGTAVPGLGIVVNEAGCEVDDLVYCGAVQVTVGADEEWPAFVERAVSSGWVGIEALGAISGSVAQVTRHNASAYGQTVGDVVASVRTWDGIQDTMRTFAAVDCGFVPDGSRFQEVLGDGADRYRILDVSFLFRQGDLTSPIRDDGLAGLLGVDDGARVPLHDVLAAARPA